VREPKVIVILREMDMHQDKLIHLIVKFRNFNEMTILGVNSKTK
jgi:hypothetical protein